MCTVRVSTEGEHQGTKIGETLKRLQTVKATYDPKNVVHKMDPFLHVQLDREKSLG
jgi:hypothetical protein